jgi:hypothetical protein
MGFLTAEDERATDSRPSSLDITSRKEFQFSKSGLSGIQISSKAYGKDQPSHFYIETSVYLPSSKKDIIIHAGKDAKGKVLGDVDLKNFSGHYTIELGDPKSDRDEVILEELDRVKGWSSKHEFSFTFGQRERQTFVWRHRGQVLSENREDLELVIEDPEREEDDEVFAQYERNGGEHGWKSKGHLLLKQGGGEQWELMVILTVMALIVSKNREQ